jgi:hypothetical protein
LSVRAFAEVKQVMPAPMMDTGCCCFHAFLIADNDPHTQITSK